MKGIKETGKLKTIINHIISCSTIIIVITFFLASFFLPIVAKNINLAALPDHIYYIIIVAALISTLLIVLPVIIIINLNQDRNKHIQELKETVRLFNINEDIIKKIISLSLIREVKLLNNRKEFFNELERERMQASDAKIYLMNFTRTIQEQMIEVKAKEYYEKEFKYCSDKENDNVKIYRIVSIHTRKKFKECWNMANNANEAELKNFNLAYVNVANFDNDNVLPRIIGVQIINDVVILMDPCTARIDSPQHENSMFIRSKEIAEKYISYYETLWDEIKEYDRELHTETPEIENKRGYTGFILYSGERDERKRILEHKYWRKINDNMPQEERLNEEELAKLRKKPILTQFFNIV